MSDLNQDIDTDIKAPVREGLAITEVFRAAVSLTATGTHRHWRWS